MKKLYIAPESEYIDFKAEEILTYTIPLSSVVPDTQTGTTNDSTVADDLD